VLGFTVAAALATTMLFGLAPAIAAAHTSLTSGLREGSAGTGEGRKRNRLRAGLVIVEIALALLLGIGATLTIRSLERLQAVNPGFRAENVLTAEVVLPQASYRDAAKRAGFFKTLVERVAAIPGVRSAGMVSQLPFGASKSGHEVVVEGAPPPRPGDQLIAFARTVDPDYFRTLETPLVRGRFFTARDTAGQRVAIINQTMERRLFPQQDAIGKRFGYGRADAWFTVIGIIADMRYGSLDADPDLEYYAPHALLANPGMSLVMRTELDPVRLASALRGVVRELDKDLPLSEVGSLADKVGRSTSTRRFSTGLLGGFALLALGLAALGIYGVVSYSVTRRTHEIGLRIALGAAPRRIAAMVVGRALILGAGGVGLGIGGSLALTRLLRSMLYGVSATDPAVFTTVALFLLAVCGLAAYLPARRAARVDPLIALRHE
jgi:predicted permease